MNYTREVAAFTSEIYFDELPKSVVERVKLCILDIIGCALAGSEFPISNIIQNFIKESGGRPEASVINGACKVPASNAIFSNVMLATSAGISDTHLESSCHPGRAAIFASLAAAEKKGATGKDLITATAVGYEVAILICQALGPFSVYKKGFHSSMLGLPFGSAASTGKILKLDENQMINAFGLIDLWEPRMKAKALKESDSFFIKYAGSAQNGFLAALLAQKGVAGFTRVLDDEEGFYRIFSDKYDLTKLTRNLGEKFEIMNVCFKKYACCHHIEPAIDALFAISNEFKSKEIKQINVRVPSVCYHTITSEEIIPPTSISAMFNGRYLMAVAALREDLFRRYRIFDYLDKMRNNPEVKELAQKVKLISDPHLDKIYPDLWAAIVEVKTESGKVSNRIDLDPKKNQADREEVENKFLEITSLTMDRKKAVKIIETVHRLEEIEDIAEITDLLR